MNYTIYTHAGCTDGLFAAYIYYNHLKMDDNKVEIIPIIHKEEHFITKTGIAVFVDICPEMKVIEQLRHNGVKIIIRDHHETNRELCNKLTDCDIIFDTNRCASLICLDEVMPADITIQCVNEKISKLIKYIDDRDRWTWSQPNSHEICDAIYFNTQTLNTKMSQQNIHDAFKTIDQLPSIDELLVQGKILMAQNDRLIKQLVKQSTRHIMRIGDIDYSVMCCETRLFRSEVGNAHMQNASVDFSICWAYQLESDAFWLSLRSIDSKTDVGKIANLLGGGGHRNASGCNVKNFALMLK